MRVITIEYGPVPVQYKSIDVHRYIQKVIQEHNDSIQRSQPGRRITIHLKGEKVAVVEVRP